MRYPYYRISILRCVIIRARIRLCDTACGGLTVIFFMIPFDSACFCSSMANSSTHICRSHSPTPTQSPDHPISSNQTKINTGSFENYTEKLKTFIKIKRNNILQNPNSLAYEKRTAT